MLIPTVFQPKFRSKILMMMVGLAGLCGVAFLAAPGASAAYIQDCKDNSIIRCGAGTPDDFITKTKTNATGDLPAVYSAFGLSSSDYGRFVQSARNGTVYRDGRIVVDGQTVATNAWSIGRSPKSYSWNKSIAGKTYYASYTRDNLLNDSLPVMAMFNAKGQLEFAVMNSCGNPTTGTLVTPKYSCDMLQKSAVSGKKDTYSFTTKATATNNAKAVKYVYDFGDGATATTTSASQAVEHTYAKAGTYTATVTVYVSLPGSQTVTVTSVTCKTTITVAPPEQPKQPFQECVQLSGVILNEENHAYRFTVTTRQGNGATLRSASFDFGDGATADNVAAATPTTIVSDHTFTSSGDFTVTASVEFSTAAGVVSATCNTTVSVSAAPVCAFNPNLPADSADCRQPCQFNDQLPADSPDCTQPHVLPATGAGSMIGLFMGTSVAGGLFYRWYALKRAIRG